MIEREMIEGPWVTGATYSICHTGTTLSFAGASTFTLSSGIYNNGGSTLTLGSVPKSISQTGKVVSRSLPQAPT